MAHELIDRRGVATRLGALLLGGTLLRAGGATAGPVTIETGNQATRLGPAEDYSAPTNLAAIADIYRRMTVPIGVAGRGRFPFVVDTGANQSVISQELVARLGLPVGPGEPLNGVAGVETALTTTADLDVGGRMERGVVLSILPAAAIGGEGMLGLDRLEGRELTLDFGDRVLRISADGRSYRDPYASAVKAHRRDGQLTLVDADISGIPLIAFLDSGAENTIGNRALRSMAAARNPRSPWVETPIISVTGQTMMAEVADLPHLRIGGVHLPSWPVAFADLHTFRMWDMIDKPAILVGVDILSRFRSVCLDFAHNEVRFRLPDRVS